MKTSSRASNFPAKSFASRSINSSSALMNSSSFVLFLLFCFWFPVMAARGIFLGRPFRVLAASLAQRPLSCCSCPSNFVVKATSSVRLRAVANEFLFSSWLSFSFPYYDVDDVRRFWVTKKVVSSTRRIHFVELFLWFGFLCVWPCEFTSVIAGSRPISKPTNQQGDQSGQRTSNPLATSGSQRARPSENKK